MAQKSKKRKSIWEKIKKVLQNGSANFSTETLDFSDKKIFVKSNFADYAFRGTFTFAGVAALCITPGNEAEAPWVGYFVGVLFSVFGSLMLFITASKKRPFFDLEKQLFYPLPNERKTPVKISDISSFAVIKNNSWHELVAIRNNKYHIIYSSRGALPYIYGKMLSEKFKLPWQQSVRWAKSGFITHYLISLVVLVIFINFIGAGSYNNCIVPIKKISESKSWKETQATILYSEFNKFTYEASHHSPNHGGGLGFVIKPSKRTRQSSELIIEYEYEYQGQKYKSDRYDFFIKNPTNIGTKQMRKIAENHPAQKQVKCFVNPDNPAESVLSREIFWSSYLYNSILLVIFAGLLVAFVIISREILLILKHCFICPAGK